MPLTRIKSLGITDGTITGDDINSTFNLTGKTVTLPAGTGGKVLQVIKTYSSTSSSTSSTSFQSTSTTASITPSSTSNKILIISSSTLFWASTADSGGVATIFRGTTNIASSGDYIIRNYPINTGGTVQREGTIIFLDSPSTTSSTTYTIKIRMVWGSGSIQWGSEGNEGEGQFILMEIAG